MSENNVLVTRAEHQAGSLCQLIEQQGWNAVRFPTLEIVAVDSQDLKQQLETADRYQWFIFISTNAVNFAQSLFNVKIGPLQNVLCIAVGQATCEALSRCGVTNTLMPAEGFNSEAILTLPELQSLNGKSCLIVRGEGGRELLASTLRERGALVDYLEVYKRVLPSYESALINSYLLDKSLAAITIYSGEALQNLVQILAQEKIKKKLLTMPLVVISQRVYALAKEIGFKHIIIANEASDEAMVNALLNGEECG